MMRIRSLTLAALPLLLAACGTVVGPDYRVPEAAVVKRPEAAAPFLGASEKPFSQGRCRPSGGACTATARLTPWSTRHSPPTPTCASHRQTWRAPKRCWRKPSS